MLNFLREKPVEVQDLNLNLDLNSNHIIVQDNIHVLNTLLKEKKCVDFIYIDPPYNTKKTVFKYKDNRTTQEWIHFMYERLILARDVLAEDGAIAVSIDDNHYAYLKLIMDEVFGLKNFIANFIWTKSHTVKNDKNGVSNQQEYVLCFAKDAKKVKIGKTPIGDAYIKKTYCYKDDVGVFRVVPLYKDKNKHKYDITSPTGIVWNKGWNYNEEGFAQLVKDDLLYWGKDGNNCPTKKVYLKEVMEKSYGSLLPTSVGYTGDGKKALKNLGFDGSEFLYAKPVGLIEYLLTIFTDENSVVMDFFAGTGTTAQAVVEKNKSDDGNRRFILATNNENNIATELTIPRVKKVFENENLPEDMLNIKIL